MGDKNGAIPYIDDFKSCKSFTVTSDGEWNEENIDETD